VHVSELYLYPIKSLRGIPLERAQLDERGLQHDRRWMLVDANGVFISQREAHQLALVDVALSAHVLAISAPGMDVLRIPLHAEGPPTRTRIWRDVVDAVPVSAEADAWFSMFLGSTCRLVYMPPATRRIVDRAYVEQERIVGFADAFPLLIIGQGSLDELNVRLQHSGEQAVPMRRFRPNIVVAESPPFAEDGWQHIRIGDVDVDVVKPCARCVITTIDPETAAAGKEPLRTLSMFRKEGSKVLFGQNAVHRRPGTIAVGDAITVMGRKN
jgi:uncharacterized protein YcbX